MLARLALVVAVLAAVVTVELVFFVRVFGVVSGFTVTVGALLIFSVIGITRMLREGESLSKVLAASAMFLGIMAAGFPGMALLFGLAVDPVEEYGLAGTFIAALVITTYLLGGMERNVVHGRVPATART